MCMQSSQIKKTSNILRDFGLMRSFVGWVILFRTGRDWVDCRQASFVSLISTELSWYTQLCSYSQVANILLRTCLWSGTTFITEMHDCYHENIIFCLGYKGYSTLHVCYISELRQIFGFLPLIWAFNNSLNRWLNFEFMYNNNLKRCMYSIAFSLLFKHLCSRNKAWCWFLSKHKTSMS